MQIALTVGIFLAIVSGFALLAAILGAILKELEKQHAQKERHQFDVLCELQTIGRYSNDATLELNQIKYQTRGGA